MGFGFNIDLNVLNHLGLSLYSSTPAVLTEIVSNAWDADATEVHINVDVNKNEITIKDNGHGMNASDIKDKFLNVGYARRTDGRAKTPLYKRDVMGRKGIGKLAMFGLANKVSIYTKKQDESVIGLKVDVQKLQQAIENHDGTGYQTEDIDDLSAFDLPKGTMIVLSEIDLKINKTASYLKKHLSRRFSILGDEFDFKVFVNQQEVTVEDRGYTSNLQFIWTFGSISSKFTKNVASEYQKSLNNIVNYNDEYFEINGFIGSVDTPSELKDDEVSNNAITILSNGRIFQENILDELDNARIFTSYLVGEINANVLDATKFKDMAVSSRQGLRQNDERYIILKSFLIQALNQIDKDWDEWRRKDGLKKAKRNHPKLQDWFNSLTDPRDKAAAEKLVSKINTVRFGGLKSEQEESKKDLLRNSILAFEKLKVRRNLDQLEKLSHVDIESFRPLLSSIDDIEESYFYDITKQRLNIIEQFEKLNNDNEKEKVLQKYLYSHLWLLDPSWERTTSETEIEKNVTREIKEVEPDSQGARIDIAYKTVSGKYIIIEMKRPDVKTSIDDLIAQGRKYIKATHQWYKKNPKQMVNGRAPLIEVYFIIGAKGYDKILEDIDFTNDFVNSNYVDKQLESINGKIYTYNDLITQSRQMYSDYLNSQKEVERIKDIINNI